MSTTQQAPAGAVNGNGKELMRPAAGQVVRQEFGAQQLEAQAETAGTVLAAQARAMVEARIVLAIRRPRDWNDVRVRLLAACERPGFAGSATEKTWGAAWYRKPVGEGVEGFSIRFAEEAARAMGNLDIQTVAVYEDDAKRILTVVVTDLESNLSYPTSLTVEKTVERKFLPKNTQPIRIRTNAEGKPVYILEATPDDVFTKQQNLVSKAIRNAVLRLLPGDIQAECRDRILKIRQGEAARDPGKVAREIADGFAKLNVTPSNLRELLGHELAQASPAELTDLRELWKAIADGTTTWADVIGELRAERGEDPEQPGDPAEEPKKPALASLTDRLRAKKEKQSGEGGPTAATATAPPEAQAATDKPPSAPKADCTHEPIAKLAAEAKHRGKTYVCEACTLSVRIEKNGLLTLAE